MTKSAELFFQTVRERLAESGPQINDWRTVFSEDPVLAHPELFVGQVEELKLLANMLADALKHAYNRIFIIGPSGSGKTSFLSLIYSTQAVTGEYTFTPIYFNVEDYEKGFSAIYLGTILRLCAVLKGQLEASREDSKKYKKHLELCGSLADKIVRGNFKTVEEVEEFAKKSGVCKENVMKALQERLTKKEIVFLFDDAYFVSEDRQLFAKIEETIVKQLGGIGVFALYPETVKVLSDQKDEILKYSAALQIGSLSVSDCKELIRRRLLLVRGRNLDDAPSPDDFKPFVEGAIEYVATVARGNPLSFILKLKEAALKAKEQKQAIVTKEIAVLANAKTVTIPQYFHVTRKQNEILQIINNSENGEITVDALHEKLGVTTVTTYLHLQALIDSGLVEREKKVRTYYYRIKKNTDSGSIIPKGAGEGQDSKGLIAP
ncbi:AAA ATPase domain protein [Candidatus Norongarragalina meridionalis]|nr:AAA ATPase domain protein [Candidatus Norongarragalina meridionalis]